jgi:hypothetical protein
MIHPFEQVLSRLEDFGLLTESEEIQKEEYLLYIEQHIQPETEYIKFLGEFNKITKKRYTGDIDSRKLFYKNEAVFSQEERVKAVKAALTDPYIKDNYGILTPKFILKMDNLGKYISYSPPKKSMNQPKSKMNGDDYQQVQDF